MDEIWRKTDPRLDINKRAKIVIVDARSNWFKVGSGSVETKNDWIILTDFENYKLISADDEWPEGFVWTWAPETGKF